MYWLDTTILTLLVVGALIGAWTGLVSQVGRIVSLAAALCGTVAFNVPASLYLQEALLQGADERVARAFAYVGVFLLIYLALHYAFRLLRQAIKAAELEAFDRLAGALAGAVKMTLLLAALALGIANYNHPATRPWFERSTLAPALANGMEVLLLMVPEKYTDAFQENLRRFAKLGPDNDSTQDP